MGLTVKSIDLAGCYRKIDRIKASSRLGLFASSEAARLMDKYVPFDTGALAASADTSEPWFVSYRMEYAERVYYGDHLRFKKEHHPQARSHWDEGINKRELADKLSAMVRSGNW